MSEYTKSQKDDHEAIVLRAAKFLRIRGWEVWPETGKQEKGQRWRTVMPLGITYRRMGNKELIKLAIDLGFKTEPPVPDLN